MTSLAIDLQLATTANQLPDKKQISRWVSTALELAEGPDNCEVCIRIVDKAEMAMLNQDYRHKTGPTNVLSFPFDCPPGIEELVAVPLLGDIIVCAEVVAEEAENQHKTKSNHWAHMIVHGTLHLLGYDHEIENEAEIMEALETRILANLGIDDPYQLPEQASTS